MYEYGVAITIDVMLLLLALLCVFELLKVVTGKSFVFDSDS